VGAGGVIRLRPPVVGTAFAGVVTLAVVLGPLAAAERAFGLHAGAAAQAVVVPLGLVAGLAVLRGLRPLLVKPGGTLTVSTEQLEFADGRAVDRVERKAVGKVIVDGDDVWGRFTITVHDGRGLPLEEWTAQWPGRRPVNVVRLLSRHGWPAVLAAEFSDGRFQPSGESQ
jgi:hypothetical protein